MHGTYCATRTIAAPSFSATNGITGANSYAQLHAEVGCLAHALKEVGVGVDDRVASLLTNIRETVIAMLPAMPLGAICSSCSPDLGIRDVVDRFGQIGPKVLFMLDMYGYGGQRFDCLDTIRGVLDELPSVQFLIVSPYSGEPLKLQMLRNAVAWPNFAGSDAHTLKFAALPFDHPLHITYLSGATHVPDCIVHGAGGP